MKLVVVGVLVLAAIAAADNCTIAPPARIDCKIDSQGPCEAAGCCWGPYNGHDPWCFKPYPASPPPPTPAPPPPLPGPPFNSTALSLMKTYLRANLDIKNLGGVVASPSTSGPGGSYYYACTHPTPNPHASHPSPHVISIFFLFSLLPSNFFLLSRILIALSIH